MRTIWLASYPKSGNTWMRLLLANLAVDDDMPADINTLPFQGGIASARPSFDQSTLIESGLLDFDEIDALRPSVYAALTSGHYDREEGDTRGMSPVRFVKAHDAYALSPSGVPLFGGAQAADGAIVIVRDPRDIAPSFASHSRVSIDAAIDVMCDDNAVFCGRRDRQHRQLRQRLFGWSAHVASWLDQRDTPLHVIRYEDMQQQPADILRGALAFARIDATDAAIERAVALSAFDAVAAQESSGGFREAPHGGRFFRRGIAGGWRDELSAAQVARIEHAHAPMMRRLGYELTATPAWALAI